MILISVRTDSNFLILVNFSCELIEANNDQIGLLSMLGDRQTREPMLLQEPMLATKISTKPFQNSSLTFWKKSSNIYIRPIAYKYILSLLLCICPNRSTLPNRSTPPPPPPPFREQKLHANVYICNKMESLSNQNDI